MAGHYSQNPHQTCHFIGPWQGQIQGGSWGGRTPPPIFGGPLNCIKREKNVARVSAKTRHFSTVTQTPPPNPFRNPVSAPAWSSDHILPITALLPGPFPPLWRPLQFQQEGQNFLGARPPRPLFLIFYSLNISTPYIGCLSLWTRPAPGPMLKG